MSPNPTDYAAWLIREAKKVEEEKDDWQLLEPYFLALIATFNQAEAQDQEAMTGIFVDCATGRRPNAYPQMTYCMRELRIADVRQAITADAKAHRSPDHPTGHDEYFARHMNYWSDIHHAYDEPNADDHGMWRYYSGRRWLTARCVVPGLTGLVVNSRQNIGSSSDAVDWAESRLAEGLDTPSLRILAGLSKPPNGFEVAGLLEAVWTEAGGEAKATDALADEYLLELALDSMSGRCAMDAGLRAGFQLAQMIGDDEAIALWAAAEDDLSLARDGITDMNEAIIQANSRLLDRVERMISWPGITANG